MINATKHEPCVRVLFLGMMSLIEDQQVNLVNPDIGVQQTLVQDLRGTDYHHILAKMFVPSLLVPQVCSHRPKEMSHILVQIVAQNSRLLVYEGDAIHLKDFSLFFFLDAQLELYTYQEERYTGSLSHSTID